MDKQQIPMVGDAYTLNSPQLSCQTCINYYPSTQEAQHQARYGSALFPTPGLTQIANIVNGTGVVRWLGSVFGVLYTVVGNKLYSVSPNNGAATQLGTLNTTQGLVRHCYNNTQFQLVDGVNGYVYTPGTSTFVTITDSQYFPTNTVCFQDGYGISAIPNTNTFQLCNLNDLRSYTPPVGNINISSFGVSGDNLVTILTSHLQIWLIGATRIEVWSNTGPTATDAFPLERLPGTLLEKGCVAQYSAILLDNTLFWLGQNENGGFQVYRASGNNGLMAIVMSTPAVEEEWNKYQTVTDCQAYGYLYNGHIKAVFTFPTQDVTWVLDVTEMKWYKWLSVDSNNNYTRHLSNAFAFHNTVPYVGDYQSGRIYKLDVNSFTDGDKPIIRERTSPTLCSNEKRLSIFSLQIPCEVGAGLSSGQGSSPRAMIQISRDNGRTWGSEIWVDLGSIGQFTRRVHLKRLGSGRSFTYRIRVSDPVYTALFGSIVEMLPSETFPTPTTA